MKPENYYPLLRHLNFRKVKENLLWWIEGDKDITPYDEWNYIWICLKETISITLNNYKSQ